MKLLRIAEVHISSSRQRREFDPSAHQALMNSISQVGLINPITVRASAQGVVLVAGERRIRAIKDIWAIGGEYAFGGEAVPNGWLPCVEVGALSELAAEETEYAENSDREDLTWQEDADATSRLESIRRRLAESTGAIPPTVADISLEVRGDARGIHHEQTRRELIVAPFLADPEVRGQKSLDDAFKLLKRREETERRVALAHKVGLTFTAEQHTLVNADSCLWLADCSDAQFDVIITDPPYGMGADEFGDSGRMNMSPHDYEDSASNLLEILNIAVPHIFRVAKPQSHLYLFCDIDWFADLRERFSASGWSVHRTPLIWHKPNGARAPWPEYGPQRKWEMCLYAVRGKKPCNILAGDVVSASIEPQTKLGAQKPVALYKEFLRRSAKPGDAVADFFCGTGTIFAAAQEMKCRATGIEKSPATYAIAYERLEKLKEKK